MITAAQRGLFDETIEHRFEEFHLQNPHVLDAIVRKLRDAQSAGKTRVGMKMIFEALRWEEFLRTDRDETEFLLNNTFTSRYSRLVIERYPDLGALLQTRKLHAA